jgi:hypothetical protein
MHVDAVARNATSFHLFYIKKNLKELIHFHMLNHEAFVLIAGSVDVL